MCKKLLIEISRERLERDGERIKKRGCGGKFTGKWPAVGGKSRMSGGGLKTETVDLCLFGFLGSHVLTYAGLCNSLPAVGSCLGKLNAQMRFACLGRFLSEQKICQPNKNGYRSLHLISTLYEILLTLNTPYSNIKFWYRVHK